MNPDGSTALACALGAYRNPLHDAVIFVARPCWGRENLYDDPPDALPYRPLTEAILRARLAWGPA